MFWLVSQPLTYMKKVDPEIINNYKQEISQNAETRTAYPEIAIVEQKRTIRSSSSNQYGLFRNRFK